jgi:hypothetical protein
VVTHHVHVLLIEPVCVDDHAGEKRADHEMKARPVGGEAADRKPDEHDVPAVALRNRRHELAEAVAHDRVNDDVSDLPSDTGPIQQYQREHAPDGNIVQTRITQNALADRLPQYVEFLHE